LICLKEFVESPEFYEIYGATRTDEDAASQKGGGSAKSTSRERWLVMSRCQTDGIAQSLALICPKVDVQTYDYWKLASDPAAIKERLGGYSRIFATPEIRGSGLVGELKWMSNVSIAPELIFGAYHPDSCYVYVSTGYEEARVLSPIGLYNSILAVCAYKAGLDEAGAMGLFTQSAYQSVGYYSLWEENKRRLFDQFLRYGLDVAPDFYRWVRGGCFMHGVNHPKIAVLYDVARLLAGSVPNAFMVDTGVLPPDSLALDSAWPIYPGIADRFGCGRGSYFFKGKASGEIYTLEEFIEGSMAIYKRYDPEQLTIKSHASNVERVMDFAMLSVSRATA
jgi:hypothetical protein